MDRSTWKKWERFWADQLGGERIPVTGRHSGDVPDVAHPWLAIEVKVTGRAMTSTMNKAVEQAQLAGKATGKIPAVCWTVTGGAGGSPADHFVTLPLESFKRLTQLLENAVKVTTDAAQQRLEDAKQENNKAD